jgi:hypothetical protein
LIAAVNEPAKSSGADHRGNKRGYAKESREVEQREAPPAGPRTDGAKATQHEDRISHHGAEENDLGENNDDVRHDD